MELTKEEIMTIKPYIEKVQKQNRNPQYYLVRKKRIDGKVKRVWHKYLGTPETIENFYRDCEVHTSLKLKSFEYGRTAALMKIAEELNFVGIVNKHTGKKKMQGLTVGEYMLLIILGRADKPISKNRTAEWFEESFLSMIWSFPHKLNTKNFTNHMEYLTKDKVMQKIEDDIGLMLVKLGIRPSTIFFDTTNFFTYMEKSKKLAKKGKSKEKRNDKNLIGLALATSDENIPLFHESYPGNDHDAKVFAKIFDKIVDRLKTIQVPCEEEDIVMVIDCGCNSEDNIGKLLSKMHIVGTVKRNQVGDLFDVPLDDYEVLYTNNKKHEIKGYRTKKELYGAEFTVVMRYDPGSYKKQSKTYERKKVEILEKLEKIKQSVERVGKGRKKSIKNAIIDASKAIPEDYKKAFWYDGKEKNGKPTFEYGVDTDEEKKLYLTFGKKPIFTDKHEWTSEKIVKTYTKKDLVEKDFMWLKDTLLISVKPIFFQEDGHIMIHIFLCVIGLVFYRYMMWKLKKQDETLSGTKVIEKLEKIRIAVVKRDKVTNLQFEEMDLDQVRLFSALGLESVLKDANF